MARRRASRPAGTRPRCRRAPRTRRAQGSRWCRSAAVAGLAGSAASRVFSSALVSMRAAACVVLVALSATFWLWRATSCAPAPCPCAHNAQAAHQFDIRFRQGLSDRRRAAARHAAACARASRAACLPSIREPRGRSPASRQAASRTAPYRCQVQSHPKSVPMRAHGRLSSPARTLSQIDAVTYADARRRDDGARNISREA